MKNTLPWLCLLAFCWIAGSSYVYQQQSCDCHTLLSVPGSSATSQTAVPGIKFSNQSLLALVPANGQIAIKKTTPNMSDTEPETIAPTLKLPQYLTLYFETNSWELILTPDDLVRLDRWIALLNNDSNTRIEVNGHTDGLGEEKLNQRISRKRAEFVRDFLIEKGIDTDQLQAIGKGSNEPLTTNQTAAGRAKNRRVELILKPA